MKGSLLRTLIAITSVMTPAPDARRYGRPSQQPAPAGPGRSRGKHSPQTSSGAWTPPATSADRMSPAKERRRELKRAVWRSLAESLEEGARIAAPDQAEAMLAVARACRSAASGTNGKPPAEHKIPRVEVQHAGGWDPHDPSTHFDPTLEPGTPREHHPGCNREHEPGLACDLRPPKSGAPS